VAAARRLLAQAREERVARLRREPEIVAQDLQRDAPTEHRVAREKDAPHSALPEQAYDFVPTNARGEIHLSDVGHTTKSRSVAKATKRRFRLNSRRCERHRTMPVMVLCASSSVLIPARDLVPAAEANLAEHRHLAYRTCRERRAGSADGTSKPGGVLIGEGTSPSSKMRSFFRDGSATGTALRSARV